jgi:hypothetical protein
MIEATKKKVESATNLLEGIFHWILRRPFFFVNHHSKELAL